MSMCVRNKCVRVCRHTSEALKNMMSSCGAKEPCWWVTSLAMMISSRPCGHSGVCNLTSHASMPARDLVSGV